MTRYPLEPLAAALGLTLGAIGTNHPGLGTLAEHLGISLPTAHRHRRNGLTWTQADTYACRIGLHPANIWPEWTHDTPHDLDATA